MPAEFGTITLRPAAGLGVPTPRWPRTVPKVVNSSDRLVTCRVKASLPQYCWLHAVSTAHPEARIEVLGASPRDAQRTVTEARLHGPLSPGWEQELAGRPGVEQVEILEQDESGALCQVTHRTPPWLATTQRLGMAWRYPYWVAGGVARWIIGAPHDRIREFVRVVGRTGVDLCVEAVTRGPNDLGPQRLTPRQNDLLRRAVAEGYFDVPRRTSLTALARRLQVSKSTLSERLALIERNLIVEAAGVGLPCATPTPEEAAPPPPDLLPRPIVVPAGPSWAARISVRDPLLAASLSGT